MLTTHVMAGGAAAALLAVGVLCRAGRAGDPRPPRGGPPTASAPSPESLAREREVVWTLAREGRDADAAAYLAARPSLYRSGEIPEGLRRRLQEAERAVRTSPREASAQDRLAEVLTETAAAETGRLGGRCAVCHQRVPAVDGRSLARRLFPDRDLLIRALAALQRAAALNPGRARAARRGRLEFALAGLYPPGHGEAAGALRRARAALEQAVRETPRDPDAWNRVGMVRYKLGSTAAAASAWRRALALQPAHEEARVNLAAVPQDGRDLLRLYREGLRLRPRSAALWTNYGVLLWQAGRIEEATAAHREALRWKPGDAVAQLNLGLALKAAGDLSGAEAALRQSLRVRPNGAVGHNALGSLFASCGEWERAADAFAQAARHNPGLTAAHANLGRAYEQLGRWTEASTAYREALRRAPGRRDLRERLTGVERRLAGPAGATQSMRHPHAAEVS